MALVVLVAFGAIFARMNYMVRANGESYSATASDKSTKTIALYGMRGTIYDSNMVPLAYSRISYDVTFYRNPSRSSAADRQAYTQVLYEVIRLIESNGKTTVNDFWMKKDDSGKWVFNSGARPKRWRPPERSSGRAIFPSPVRRRISGSRRCARSTTSTRTGTRTCRSRCWPCGRNRA